MDRIAGRARLPRSSSSHSPSSRDAEEAGTTRRTESVATSADECTSVDAPAPRDPESREAPTAPLDASKTYTLTFETNCGSFTVTLDPELAPKTTASLVALAKDGYFDDTIFHRVVPGFVIQGGDPTQSGSGGPGYSTVDVPPSDAAYTKGVVAMAKAGTEAPGTAGSQFFVVTGEDAGPAARVRDRRRGHGRAGHGRADRRARDRRRPTLAAGRRLERHRRRELMARVAAVVLAAGEASRFGSPKQRLLLPRVLERLASTSVDEIVIVKGAHELLSPPRHSAGARRPVP